MNQLLFGTLALAGAPMVGLGQTLTNSGATLTVGGSVQNQTGRTFTNGGTVQLTGDLRNAGTLAVANTGGQPALPHQPARWSQGARVAPAFAAGAGYVQK